MASAELWEPNRIVLYAEYRERELCKAVPGAKWDPTHRTWYCPLSWATCVSLRGVFGNALEIGPALNAWGAVEAERASTCIALRDAEDLSAPLYRAEDLEPRQRVGVYFLTQAERALQGDDRGAGKTVQAICAIETLAEEDGAPYPVLVVCPNSMVYEWEKEIHKWAPQATVTVVKGGAVKRRKLIEAGADYFVINWEGLKGHSRLAPFGNISLSDKDKAEKELNAAGIQTVIADEVHHAISPRAQQTRAWWWLSWDARYSIGMTGTPIVRNPECLWSIMHGIHREEWPSKTAWIDRYCVPPDSPVWMADGTFKAIGDVEVGDAVIGFSKLPISGRGVHPRLEQTQVLAVNRHEADLVRVTTDSGRSFLCTPDHRWLSGWHRQSRGGPRVMMFSEPHAGVELNLVVEPPPSLPPELERDAAWLGGIYDGEASGMRIAQSRGANPDVWEEIGRVLDRLGFDYTLNPDGYKILGGRSAYAKLLHYCRPIKRHKTSAGQRYCDISHFFMGSLSRRRGKERIVSVEPSGRGEVVSLTTGTQTYVVHGYASHNCLQSWNAFGGREVSGLRPDTRDELFRYLDARFIHRPLAVVVPDLVKPFPPRIREIDLTPKQRKAYDSMRKEMLTQLDDGVLTAFTPLARLTRLRQLASAYGTLEGGNFVLTEPSSKLDALDDLLSELGDEQLVVFAESRQLIELAAARLERRKISHGLITGHVPPHVRSENVDAFQAGQLRVMLMTAAGSEGLTLHSAANICFLEESFSHAVNLQVEGRVVRRGQTRKVQPTYIRARNTVETRVAEIAQEKSDFLEEINRDEAALRALLA